eukprot:1138504-Pelagomonas_calceolata.AAC.6
MSAACPPLTSDMMMVLSTEPDRKLLLSGIQAQHDTASRWCLCRHTGAARISPRRHAPVRPVHPHPTPSAPVRPVHPGCRR